MAGRGEKSLICDPGSELRLEGSRSNKGEGNKCDGKKREVSTMPSRPGCWVYRGRHYKISKEVTRTKTLLLYLIRTKYS